MSLTCPACAFAKMHTDGAQNSTRDRVCVSFWILVCVFSCVSEDDEFGLSGWVEFGGCSREELGLIRPVCEIWTYQF